MRECRDIEGPQLTRDYNLDGSGGEIETGARAPADLSAGALAKVEALAKAGSAASRCQTRGKLVEVRCWLPSC